MTTVRRAAADAGTDAGQEGEAAAAVDCEGLRGKELPARSRPAGRLGGGAQIPLGGPALARPQLLGPGERSSSHSSGCDASSFDASGCVVSGCAGSDGAGGGAGADGVGTVDSAAAGEDAVASREG